MKYHTPNIRASLPCDRFVEHFCNSRANCVGIHHGDGRHELQSSKALHRSFPARFAKRLERRACSVMHRLAGQCARRTKEVTEDMRRTRRRPPNSIHRGRTQTPTSLAGIQDRSDRSVHPIVASAAEIPNGHDRVHRIQLRLQKERRLRLASWKSKRTPDEVKRKPPQKYDTH